MVTQLMEALRYKPGGRGFDCLGKEKVKVKVKVILEQATKAQRGIRGIPGR